MSSTLRYKALGFSSVSGPVSGCARSQMSEQTIDVFQRTGPEQRHKASNRLWILAVPYHMTTGSDFLSKYM
jgi:hypothetical protein